MNIFINVTYLDMLHIGIYKIYNMIPFLCMKVKIYIKYLFLCIKVKFYIKYL